MKKLTKILLLLLATVSLYSCEHLDDILDHIDDNNSNKPIKFTPKKTISLGGEGASEISAYDPTTKMLYVTSSEKKQVEIFDISDLNSPKSVGILSSGNASPNSVSAYKGKLAIAFENEDKQQNGNILVYDGKTSNLLNSYTVGALPDMVTFSPNGRYILVANEGEPNDDYTIDPKGTISIIDLNENSNTLLDFNIFNSQEAELESRGLRVFGPNANLASDVEPEYVTVSDDSKTAWVSLQENNGIAKVDLISKTITDIFPLGFKDFSLERNSFDASDKDDEKILIKWPVKGMYQPDAIKYFNINGQELIFSANEGDARDYDGFSEEKRINKIKLDRTVFPENEGPRGELTVDENLGRLKITTANGDIDNDGDFDEIYAYGGRSFSIWDAKNGGLIYDSGNSIAQETLALTPARFNDNDKRSDDKGAEPEAVDILKIKNKYILFVGLERNDQVLMYDVTNPTSPIFMDILANSGDEAPEGLLAIAAKDSPTGKDLLIVTNEDSGTVTFYENN